MRIAVTGGTGFIGRYILRRLARDGHELRAWCRADSDRSGLDGIADSLTWVEGELNHDGDAAKLIDGCEAVVHSALSHPGGGFRGGEGDLRQFVAANVLGTIDLIEAARAAGVRRFVQISTCAVHEVILDDRPLDEAHPLWATSHYGAHKAAIEKFVHSYGLGARYEICALRPTGVYGEAHPVEESKWFQLVQKVVAGDAVNCSRGGKEVHAADVAEAVNVLLHADAEAIRGQAFNCYDRYVSQWEVAQLAKELSGSDAHISGEQTSPKHQIETGKLRSLGMKFGGERLLKQTVENLVAAAR